MVEKIRNYEALVREVIGNDNTNKLPERHFIADKDVMLHGIGQDKKRNIEILFKIYGITYPQHSYKEASKEISGTRCAQIARKAIRILQSKNIKNCFLTGRRIKEILILEREQLEAIRQKKATYHSKHLIKDYFDFSTRTRCCLLDAGINTVAHLLMCNNKLLLSIPNLGRKSLNEILEALKERGLELGVKQYG